MSTVATQTQAGVPDLRSMSGDQLDALYRASRPGPIPIGRSRGTAIALPGSPLGKLFAGFVRALVWKGKVFDPQVQGLKNLMSPLGIPAIKARVYEGDSWFVRNERAIVLDYSRTSLVAKLIRDEIREVGPGLYLGQVYIGKAHVLRFMLEFPKGGAAA